MFMFSSHSDWCTGKCSTISAEHACFIGRFSLVTTEERNEERQDDAKAGGVNLITIAVAAFLGQLATIFIGKLQVVL